MIRVQNGSVCIISFLSVALCFTHLDFAAAAPRRRRRLPSPLSQMNIFHRAGTPTRPTAQMSETTATTPYKLLTTDDSGIGEKRRKGCRKVVRQLGGKSIGFPKGNTLHADPNQARKVSIVRYIGGREPKLLCMYSIFHAVCARARAHSRIHLSLSTLAATCSIPFPEQRRNHH